MTKIRVLIVDDEPVARKGIRALLNDIPEVEVVGECSTGMEAVAVIRAQPLDLVFLDVQMPEMNGFEVIEHIGVERMPTVIFVTAYDQYALKAFEVHALDYLLKPFNRERLHQALQRALRHLRRRHLDNLEERLLALLEAYKSEATVVPTYVQRLVVKSAGYIFFLNVDEIDWIEAAGNYVRLHVAGKTHLLRDTMSAMEQKLDPATFVRIHRSAIVNLHRLKRLRPLQNSEYALLLHDGTELTSSRRYRKNLSVLLESSS